MMYRLFSFNDIFLRTFSQTLINCRYVRIPRASEGPKFIKGKIKTVSFDPDIEDYHANRATNYQDFSKLVKSSVQHKIRDEDIEEAFLNEDEFGTIFEKTDAIDSQYIREDAEFRKQAKFKIIGRKYFKLDKETNLLTHAAKEQIKYLNKTNPEDWTPEALSQSFPITPGGVKKLLKCNYVCKTQEQIRKHDEEVAQRWKLLKSGQHSSSISPYTQQMWDEGKIIEEHFEGNPDLPEAPPATVEIVIEKEKVPVGEYAAIIQQYVNYKKEKESMKEIKCSSEELLVKDEFQNSLKNKEYNKKSFPKKYNYHIDDETDDTQNQKGFKKSLKTTHSSDRTALLHSQFKLNLKEEMKDPKSDSQYDKWARQQSEKKTESISGKPVNAKEVFSKIPKYNIEFMELKKDNKNAFLYDEKLGYQHVKQKPFKARINVPTHLHKKGTTYKVGQCIYDDNGELLYKIPG